MYVAFKGSKAQHDEALFYRGPREVPLTSGVAIDTTQGARWLLRGWKWMAIAALAGAVAGLVGAQLVTPRFTATTELTIAPSNLQVAPNDLYATNIQSDSQILDVESKMRLITSGNVLRRVVDKLSLQDDPEFNEKPALFDLGGL